MFTSIFESLSEGLGDLLDTLITAFMSALTMSLRSYLIMFPFLGTVYSMLQSMAFGLIAVIAGKQLATFWLGSVDSDLMQDRPVNILFRAFIASMAVYFGGYILSYITSWATVPFDAFVNATGGESGLGLSQTILLGAAGLGSGVVEAGVAPMLALSDLAIAMLEFLLLLLIAVNLFKLAVEVCERYMLVGIIVFTAPIAYPTLTTKTSSQIFKKWCSMFIGSLVMMSVSVIFLKLIVNGLSHLAESALNPGGRANSAEFFVRLLIILATCKIAQRADSYLQQLGLNVATTGGNMLDDVMALAYTLRRGKSHASNSVLGGAAKSLGSRTPIGRGFKKAASDFAAGKSARESFAAGRKATADAYKANTGFGRAFTAAREAKANAAATGITDPKIVRKEAAGAAAKGFVTGTMKGAGNMVKPGDVAAHDELQSGEQERKNAEAVARANAAASKARQRETSVGDEPLSRDALAKLESGRPITNRDAQQNLEKSGVLSDDGRAFITDTQSGDDTEIGISDRAKAAGLVLQSTADGQDYVAGPSRSAGEFLANATSQAADIPQNVGSFAREDDSLGSETERMEAYRVSRGEYAVAKNAAIQTSINQAPAAALERMLTGSTAVSGTREMAESLPAAPSPQRKDESDEDYAARYSREMRGVESFYTQKNAEGGFNPYAVPVAEKVFADVIPQGSNLVSYEAVDGGISMDRYGHPIDHGRIHVLTCSGPNNSTDRIEVYDNVAYSALSDRAKTQGNFGTFTSSTNTLYYIKDRTEVIVAEPKETSERKLANIITNLGSKSKKNKSNDT